MKREDESISDAVERLINKIILDTSFLILSSGKAAKVINSTS